MKTVPFGLDLKAGKVIGSIMAIDELGFGLLQLQRAQVVRQPGVQAQWTTEVSDISFEQCSGKKYLHRTAAPDPWKQVDYVLRVPGNFVSIELGTMRGADFDEGPFESKLHTLRLSASA